MFDPDDIWEAYSTDEKAELEGVWTKLAAGEAEYLIARKYNKKYNQLFNQMTKPYQSLLARGGAIPQGKDTQIMARAMSETILLNWRGVKRGGAEVAYTKDLAYEALKIRDFRLVVDAFSDNMDNYRAEAVEAAKKSL